MADYQNFSMTPLTGPQGEVEAGRAARAAELAAGQRALAEMTKATRDADTGRGARVADHSRAVTYQAMESFSAEAGAGSDAILATATNQGGQPIGARALQPTDLVTVSGMTMQVQHAVRAGLVDAAALGKVRGFGRP